jgi:membrane protease subunit (stomatin/prohibitin family)
MTQAPHELAMLESRLEEAGIPVARVGMELGGGYLPISVELHVPDEHAAAARQVIAAFNREQQQQRDPGADWTCWRCGETNPGNFETCWNCGENRLPE